MSSSYRADQILYNYGPGAIIETMKGPVVVKDFGGLSHRVQQLNAKYNFPTGFEINEPRLSKQLAHQVYTKLYKIPSNQSLDIDENKSIIDTRPFPNWNLCRNAPQHPSRTFILYESAENHCPICQQSEKASPIRFIRYCKAGHLDNLPWASLLHGQNRQCGNRVFEWDERASNMASIHLSCNSCNTKKRLSEMAAIPQTCNAYSPEKINPQGAQCNETMKITLRQSAVLWQAQIRKVISLPEDDFPQLVSQAFGQHIQNQIDWVQLMGMGATMLNYSSLPEIQAVVDQEWKAILQVLTFGATPAQIKAILKLAKQHQQISFNELKETYHNLLGGAVSVLSSFKREYKGLLKDRDNRPTTNNKYFTILENNHSATLGRLKLVGEPVTRLRQVMALAGFSRGPIDEKPKSNSIAINIDGIDWYPATEAYGEGILLWLDGEASLVGGDRWQKWEAVHQTFVDKAMSGQQDELPLYSFRSASSIDDTDRSLVEEAFTELRPEFVWWHTFAHHLIRVIQAETGYSSSAIQERIYTIKENGEWKSAILLYVTEGGMSGTLGGLVSLLENLQYYFDLLISNAEVCSNDPLCEEHDAPVLPNIGCYACTMNPETSCDHRNLFIDRLLLLEAI